MKTTFFSNCMGVFQGGGCRGVAYVGAYRKSVELGIFYSELVGTSAGSIVATLIGAGARPDQLEKMMRGMDFGSMRADPEKIIGNGKIKFWDRIVRIIPFRQTKLLFRIIDKLGLHSSAMIETRVADCLAVITGINDRPVLFGDLIIPTCVVATDLAKSRLKIWSTHDTPEYEVAKAVRSSCSIPIFYQPVDGRFVDGGLLSNLPSFIFKANKESHYGKVLAYCLNADGFQNELSDIHCYLSALAGAVVDGAQELQMKLQENVYCVNISTGSVQATDFDKMTDGTIKTLIQNGASAVDKFVREEFRHVSGHKPGNVCATNSEALNLMTGTVGRDIDRVVVSKPNGQFVYDIFLTLLNWCQNGVQTQVFLVESSPDDIHAGFQHRMLKALGFDVTIVKNLCCDALIVHSADMETAMAIVEVEVDGKPEKVVYKGEADRIAVRTISNYVEKARENPISKLNPVHHPAVEPRLLSVDEETYLKLIKSVSQYKSETVKMEIRDVYISNVCFLTKYIRGYKYRQISVLIELYQKAGVPLFSPTKIQYTNESATFVGIPVVEELNGVLYVIEGNTRLYYMFRQGVSSVKCLVVRKVKDPLPSKGSYGIDEMLLSEGDHKGESRYEKFSYHHFRHIERAVRDPETSLM